MKSRKKAHRSIFSFASLFMFFFGIAVIGMSVQVILRVSGFLPQAKVAAVIEDFSGQFKSDKTIAYFLNKPVAAPIKELPEPSNAVLGSSTDEKWVEVDLSDQVIRAWEGNNLFLESLTSTGKWGRTPTGEFRVWTKLRYTTMSGGDRSINTYYYLPNVPYVQFFGNSEVPASLGYSLHGTYWHNNFGTTMSHGCVNLPTDVAEKLFYWSNPPVPEGKTVVSTSKDNPGLKIVIHE